MTEFWLDLQLRALEECLRENVAELGKAKGRPLDSEGVRLDFH